MTFNAKIFIKYYKFCMINISLNYPKYPNDVTKKKYYDFINNIPLLFPNNPLGNNFIKYLDNYPVTPYLDSRKSFIKWIHFINNKINIDLNLKEETLEDSLKNYYDKFKKPKKEKNKIRKYVMITIFWTLLIILVFINFL